VRHPVPIADSDAPPALTGAPSIERTVRAWHHAGHSQRAIARELNLDRRKIKRMLDKAT
jgi:DNA-binding transcriptional regulator LsrR (DeoR family)